LWTPIVNALGAGWIEFIDGLRLSMSIIAELSRRVGLNVAAAGINPAAQLFNHAQQP
jgi:hypothetical protein